MFWFRSALIGSLVCLPGLAAAQFPQIVGPPVISSLAASGLSHPVDLPPLATGNTGLMLLCLDSGEFIIDSTVLPNGIVPGWTLADEFHNGGAVTMLVYTRTADGTEGATVTADWTSTGDTEQVSAIVHELSGVGAVEVGAPRLQFTNAYNPLAYVPSWGLADVLWFATLCTNGSANQTAVPAGYTASGYSEGSGVANATASMAQLELAAASEDPGPFATDTDGGISVVLAVGPPGGPGGGGLGGTLLLLGAGGPE